MELETNHNYLQLSQRLQQLLSIEVLRFFKKLGHGCKHSSSKAHFAQTASRHVPYNLLQLVMKSEERR
jgi:hypothetical protein